MNTSWFVTGGAGFIGSNFVRHVLARRPHDRVTVYDALTYAGHEVSLDGCAATGRFEFVHGDVCDAVRLAAEVDRSRADVLVHLAAETHVDRSLRDPGVFVRTNVEGTFRVLEVARARRGLRTLVVGTDEVYGSIEAPGVCPEEAPLRPSSPYSASKASADLLTLSYATTYAQDVVVTRCSNNYGPYQMPEKLIPLMTLAALRNESLPVYGDGLHVRDWIHVDDACRGLACAVEHGVAGRVYNLGGANERTNLDVVRALLARLDKPADRITFVQDRPGHDRRYAMDTTRARAELGFSPTLAFDEGLAQTVDWYRAHEAWLRAVDSPSHQAHLRDTYAHRPATERA